MEEETLAIAYVDDVAPEMELPLKSHWYVNGPVPAAVTLKVALAPAVVVMFWGCALIVGAPTEDDENTSFRIVELLVSARYKLLELSMAIPSGALNVAALPTPSALPDTVRTDAL